MGYEQLEHDLWDHPLFRALSPAAKLLYLWAWTNHRGGVSGCFKCPIVTVRTETRLTALQIVRALPDLSETMLRHYADADEWWVIPKARRARSPQQRTGVMNQVADCRNERFRADWSATYPDLIPEAWRYPIHRVSGGPDRVSPPNVTVTTHGNANAVKNMPCLGSHGEESACGESPAAAGSGLAAEVLRTMSRLAGPERARRNAGYYRALEAWVGEDAGRLAIVRAALTQTRDDARSVRRDGKPVIRTEAGAYFVGILRRECLKRGLLMPGGRTQGGPPDVA